MELKVKTNNGLEIKTTGYPIRADGELLLSDKYASLFCEHNNSIDEESIVQPLQTKKSFGNERHS